MRVALIGLGKMGIEVAGNLMKAGHTLTVYNRTAAKAEALERIGATVAKTPADAAQNAEVVFTIVLDDAALDAVTFGPDGILHSLPPGSLHVGLSTISIDMAKRLEHEHRLQGQDYLSAPVLGRPEAARGAKLIFIAGGPTPSLAKVQPIFDALGRFTLVAGAAPWQANLFKLCSNFMISSMIESFGEAQALVRKSGSDPKEFVSLMSEFWGSPIYRTYGSLIATRSYDPPGGTLALGLKDNRLLLDAARELAVPLPTASLIRDQMLSAIAAGNAELDWSSLTDTAIRNAGLPTK
jgi:3-hydroxyisobutyrate dehydrogenase-like beta-hydroxyacid dehydrogenase